MAGYILFGHQSNRNIAESIFATISSDKLSGSNQLKLYGIIKFEMDWSCTKSSSPKLFLHTASPDTFLKVWWQQTNPKKM